MPVLSDLNDTRGFLVAEDEKGSGRGSRDVVVLDTGDLSVGAVVGKILTAVPTTGDADVDNTGDATMGSVAGGRKTQIGDYTITCIKAPSAGSADDAEFSVVAPDGDRLADAVQAVAYANEHLEFTISGASAADSVVGDVYTVTVAAGSGKVVELAPAGTDGSQVAAGILIDNYDASEGDVEAVMIARDAQIVASGLAWPDGITVDQKNQALADLAALGIHTKEEA